MEKTKVFIAYARKDEEYLNRLRTYLAPLERNDAITMWYDGLIDAGTKWNEEIKTHLHSADLIMLLVSANSLASDYFWNEEMQDALARHERKEAIVVPVILRHCGWASTDLQKLQALPKDGKPVTAWSDDSAAYYSIFQGIEKNVKKIQTHKKQAAPAYAQATRPHPIKIVSQNKNNFGKILKIALSVLIVIAAIIGTASWWNNHPPNDDSVTNTTTTQIDEATTKPPQTITNNDEAIKQAAEDAAKKERERLAKIQAQQAEKRKQDSIAQIQQQRDQQAAAGVAARQKDEKEKQDNYNRLVKNAEEKYNSNAYSGAKVLYEEALNYISDGSEALNGIALCDNALKKLSKEQQAAAEATAQKKAQQEKQNNYNRLIKNAKDKYSSSDYSGAKALYQEALTYTSGSSEVSEAAKGISLCDKPININKYIKALHEIEKSIKDSRLAYTSSMTYINEGHESRDIATFSRNAKSARADMDKALDAMEKSARDLDKLAKNPPMNCLGMNRLFKSAMPDIRRARKWLQTASEHLNESFARKYQQAMGDAIEHTSSELNTIERILTELHDVIERCSTE